MNEKLLSKIKKLFALSSNNPNSNEAAVAMKMAQKLLEKHNLTVSDLHDKDKVSVTFRSEANATWIKTIYNQIAKLYDVEYIVDKTSKPYTHLLIGRECNRVTTCIVIDYVRDIIRKDSVGMGNEFRMGAAYGIAEQVRDILMERNASKEEVIPGTGLIPVDLARTLAEENNNWTKENIGRISHPKQRASRVSEAGLALGRRINLGPQIGSGRAAIGAM